MATHDAWPMARKQRKKILGPRVFKVADARGNGLT